MTNETLKDKRKDKQLKKLKNFLDKAESGNPRGKYKVPLYIMREVENAYFAISENRAFSFNSYDLKNILESCGVPLEQEMIGWRVKE